jgi:uncharacterized protein (DUF1330 family)
LSVGTLRSTIAAPSNTIKEEVMKTYYTVGLSMLAGFGLGTIAVQSLHAQAKPPVYTVSEIDVTNVDAYTKEYVPLARAAIKKVGGKLLGASQQVTALEGDPPKTRIAINVWESLEKAKAWRDSPDYKEARKIGDKYAKFRSYVVDGVPQ